MQLSDDLIGAVLVDRTYGTGDYLVLYAQASKQNGRTPRTMKGQGKTGFSSKKHAGRWYYNQEGYTNPVQWFAQTTGFNALGDAYHSNSRETPIILILLSIPI
jgi:hypothetical protein